MTRAEALATAKAALRAIARGLGRVAVYLGPLILAALAYIFRLVVDAAHGARVLSLRRRKRKAPERIAEFELIENKLRDTKAARWATWHAVPARRRLAVRTAAVAILVAIVATVRARYRTPAQPQIRADATTAATTVPTSPSDALSSGPAPTPPVDLKAAAARFEAARQRLGRSEWTVFGDAPVLERGARGAWDDYAVGSPVVIREDSQGTASSGRGARFRMWYLGCHLAMREHACGVGHATSSDGVVWEKRPQPVFQPPDPVAQDNLTEIAVLKTGDRYYLWYSVAADYAAGRRRATVNLATSPDGLVWADQGQVLEGEGPLPLTIEHSVLHDGQSFHMWYVAAIEELDAPVLRHLSSADGKTWTAVGGTPLKDLEKEMSSLGRLLVEAAEGGGFRALSTRRDDDQELRSSALGVLVSSEGTTWQMQALDVDPFKASLERDANLRIRAVTGVHDPAGLWLWATLVDVNRHDERIGVAFRNGG